MQIETIQTILAVLIVVTYTLRCFYDDIIDSSAPKIFKCISTIMVCVLYISLIVLIVLLFIKEKGGI
jgi:hypothetical protein